MKSTSVTLLILLLINLSYSSAAEKNITVDTSRFSLHTSQDGFILKDKIGKTSLILKTAFLFSSDEELADEMSYVSSFIFFAKS